MVLINHRFRIRITGTGQNALDLHFAYYVSLQLSKTTSVDEQIAAIVKNLGGRGQSRPRKVKTLQNTINSLFTKKLNPAELKALAKELQKRKLIVVDQSNVSYKLPR